MSGRLRLATGETSERLGDPDLVRRTLRLLACEIELDVDCDRLERGLGWMAANALQSMEITRRHRLTVRRRDEGYAIDCDGEAVSWEPEPGQAAVRLSSLAHELALAALPDPSHQGSGDPVPSSLPTSPADEPAGTAAGRCAGCARVRGRCLGWHHLRRPL